MAFAGGKKTTKKVGSKTPTKSDLELRLGRIKETEEQVPKKGVSAIFSKLGKGEGKLEALNTLGKVLRVIDYPRRKIVTGLTGKETVGEFLEEKGAEGFWQKDVPGFVGDVLLDPTTYLTAGTAGLGKQAVKEGAEQALKELGEKGVKEAAKRAGKEATEEALEGAAKAAQQKVFGKGETYSQILKGLTKEEYKALPSHLRGGIRLNIPFRTKGGIRIVPGRATSKISAPLSEAGLAIPGVDELLNKVTPFRQMLREGGVGGREAQLALRKAAHELNTHNMAAEVVLKNVDKTFGRKSAEAIEHALTTGFTKGAKEEAAVKGLKELLENTQKMAKEAGFEVPNIENFFPAIKTPALRKALFGADTGIVRGAGVVPEALKETGDVKALQKQALEEFGIEGAYEPNVVRAIANYVKSVNKAVVGKGMVDSNLIPKGVVAAASLPEVGKTEMEDIVSRAGYGSIEEAQADIRNTASTALKLTDEGSSYEKFVKVNPRLEGLSPSAFNVLRKATTFDSKVASTLGAREAAAMSDTLGRLATKASKNEGIQQKVFNKIMQQREATTKLQQKAVQIERAAATDTKGIANAKQVVEKYTKELETIKSYRPTPTKTIKAFQKRRDELTQQITKAVAQRDRFIREFEGNRTLFEGLKDTEAAEVFEESLSDIAAKGAAVQEEITKLRATKDAIVKDLAEKLRRNSAIGKKAQVEENLAKAQTRLDKLEGTRQANIAGQQQAVEKQLASKTSQIVKLEDQYRKVPENLEEIQQEIQNLISGSTAKNKPWPVPTGVTPNELAKQPGWGKIDGTSWGALNGKYAPESVAREINTMFKRYDPGMFMKLFDNYMSLFRTYVTIPFPGFHLRNLLGVEINNTLGGVGPKQRLAAAMITAKHVSDDAAIPGYNFTKGEIKKMLGEQGILGSPYMQVLGDYTGELPTNKLARAVMDKLQHNLVTRKGSDTLSAIETYGRSAAFLKGLDLTGTPTGARAFTMVRHGDYSELTAAERQLKRVIPFYKWMRTNIPFQLQNLIEAPGRTATIEKFFTNVIQDPEQREQFEQDKLVPGFIQDRAGLLMRPGVGEFLGGKPGQDVFGVFGSPIQDLAAFGQRGDTTARLSPIIETAMEILTDRKLNGTQRDLGRVEVPRTMKPLAVVMEKIPVLQELFIRSNGGELMVDERFLVVLGALPTTRIQNTIDQLFPNAGHPAATTSLESRLVSPVTGVTSVPITEEGQEMEANRRERELDEMERELQKIGYDVPNKPKPKAKSSSGFAGG